MTVHDCVVHATALLTSAGFPPADARRDATVLARFALGWSLADWASRSRETAPKTLGDRLIELVARRAVREPVAYITGTREFYGRPFQVTPAVLIPRPETEGVVAEALLAGFSGSSGASGASGAAGARPLIVDIGTGSGCIAITLALEGPAARIVATDISRAALDVARTNAAALGVTTVEFLQVIDNAFVPAGLPAADLIVSNPPYVPERDRTSLMADVRDFEPATALFAGDDGLDVIRLLLPAAARALAAGGSVVMEIGAGQSDAVIALAVRAGFNAPAVTPDLQGIPRVLVARKRVDR